MPAARAANWYASGRLTSAIVAETGLTHWLAAAAKCLAGMLEIGAEEHATWAI